VLASAALSGTDDCASGTVISGSGALFTANLFSSNTPSDLPAGSCFASSVDQWFTYSAGSTGNATFSFCPEQRGCASYDTVLAAYSSCGGAQIACNDDFCGLHSSIVVPVIAGNTYKIRVAGFSNLRGTGVLGFTAPPAPPNDNCINATPIGNGIFAYSNIGATTDGPSNCGLLGSDVWFRYTAPCNGNATATTCSAARTYDTVMSVFDGGTCPPGTLLGCNDDGPPSCPNPPAPFSGSTVVFAVTAGTARPWRARAVAYRRASRVLRAT
jgi:hypothetical protein